MAVACGAWAVTPSGSVSCTLETLGTRHRGGHRSGPWAWRTGEEPTRHEMPALRKAAPDDLPALCRELAALAQALDAALPRSVRPDRSQVRRVPNSRPPLDLEVLVATEQLTKSVRAMTRELRAALGHVTGYRTLSDALDALPGLVEALPDGHALRLRVPAVVQLLRDRARRLLQWDEEWIALGPCPGEWPGDPVDVLTRDGLVEGDAGCWTLDGKATTAAAARGEDTQVWRRSTLAVRRDAGAGKATITCRACGYTCTPEQRACDIVLASGEDLVAPARQLALLLAVPEGTVYRWAHEGVITPVGESKPPMYSAAALARVVVDRRVARPQVP